MPSSSQQYKPVITEERLAEVRQIVEDRKKERMKFLIRNLEVCDLSDLRNPQMVTEYANDILKQLHIEEKRHLYPDDFLKNQPEINEKMRAYLIDWLSELHLKFKLLPETLYVCVGLIDKYL